MTLGLEGRCSIQLSYGQTARNHIKQNTLYCYKAVSQDNPSLRQGPLALASAHLQNWSGRRDSNSRPSAPKADALPGCATPRKAQHYTAKPCSRSNAKCPTLRKPAPPPYTHPACTAASQSAGSSRSGSGFNHAWLNPPPSSAARVCSATCELPHANAPNAGSHTQPMPTIT